MGSWLQVAPRSLGENLAALASAQLLTWVLTGVTLTLLPRYFGPTDFGRIALGITIAGFATTFSGLGMPTLVTKLVARDGLRAADQVLTALLVTVGIGVVASFGLFAVLPVLGYHGETRLLIAISLAAVPATLCLTVGVAVLQGFEVMRLQAVIDVAGKIAALGIVIAVIVGRQNAVVYAIATSVIGTLVAVPAMVVAFRALKLHTARPRHVRQVVLGGLPLYTTDIFLAVYVTVDLVLLSLLAEERDVGLYAAPLRIFSTLLFLPNVLGIVLLPRLSHTFATNGRYFATLAYWSLASVFIAAVPISIAGSMLSGEAAVVIFGHSFADSGAVSIALALSIVPTSLNVVLARVFIAADRQLYWTGIMAVALAAKVVLNLAFIPLFAHEFDNAALGAAVGLVGVELLMMVAGLLLIPRLVRGELTTRKLARAVFCGGMAMLALLAGYLAEPWTAGFLALAVYAVCGFATGLLPRSRSQLRMPVTLLRSHGEEVEV